MAGTAHVSPLRVLLRAGTRPGASLVSCPASSSSTCLASATCCSWPSTSATKLSSPQGSATLTPSLRTHARHSHIGSAPLDVAKGTEISILGFPPQPNPLRPQPGPLRNARTILVKGPLGTTIVPLMEGVKLDWRQARVKGKVKQGDTEGQAQLPSGTTTGGTEPTAPPKTDEQQLHVSLEVPGKEAPKHLRAQWGLTRALLANAIEGVEKGHVITLKLVGVGYRAVVEQDPYPRPSKIDIALAAERTQSRGVRASGQVAAAAATATMSDARAFFTSPEQVRLYEELNADSGSKDANKPQRLNIRMGYSHPVLVPIPRGIEVSVPQPTVIQLKGCDKEKLGLLASQIRAWRKPEPYKGKGVFVDNESIRLKTPKKK